MKNFKSYLLIVLSLVFLYSCSNSDEYRIKGVLNGAEGKKLYLMSISDTKPVLLDSALLDKEGGFDFKGNANDLSIYRLSVGKKYVDVIVKNGDKITIEANHEDMGAYNIEGSDASEELKKFIVLVDAFGKSVKPLQDEYMKHTEEGTQLNDTLLKSLNTRYDKEVKEFVIQIKEFVSAHPKSIASVYAINYLDPVNEIEYMSSFATGIKDVYPDNIIVTNFVNQIERMKGISIGNPAPEINLPGPDGKALALSSFKGQYVLIDFWASWCGPCRQESPNMVRLYKKYKSKGLEIYGVSLDENADKWKMAIKKDAYTWPQVSDLKGWESQAAYNYQVDAIPATFIIDKQGNLLGKNLRGKELEEFLEKLLP